MPTADEWRARVPGLKWTGSQWQGPCPVCVPPGKDRFRVMPDGRFFCRICCPDGGDVKAMKALLEAAGLDGDRQGVSGKHAPKTGVSRPKGGAGWW